MAEISSQNYLDYLLTTYSGRSSAYYGQFQTLPLRPGDAVLDWGCGLGGMLEHVVTFSPGRLAGLDLNPECVRYVRERHPEWQIELLSPPGLRSAFASASFDRVFLLDVIEHVHERRLLLEECYRILKPGGILTLSTPDRLAFHKLTGYNPFGFTNLVFNLRHLLGLVWVDPTHVTEWSAMSLRAVLENSPFTRNDFHPSPWHAIPWVRPPRRHYSFVVNLFKNAA